MIVFSYPSEDYFNSLYYSQKQNLKMKKKRLYEKPSTEVVELQQRSQLLTGSGGTEQYTPDDTPYNW